MMKNLLAIVKALIGAAAVIIFTLHSAGATDDRTLVSAGVKKAPQNSGSSEWNKAKESNVLLTGAGTFDGQKITIKVKSVYTDDMVFFLFDWPDTEKSMGKKEWRLQDGTWKAKKADEDRLGVLFEINRINKSVTTNQKMKKIGILLSIPPRKKVISGIGNQCDRIPSALPRIPLLPPTLPKSLKLAGNVMQAREKPKATRPRTRPNPPICKTQLNQHLSQVRCCSRKRLKSSHMQALAMVRLFLAIW